MISLSDTFQRNNILYYIHAHFPLATVFFFILSSYLFIPIQIYGKHANTVILQ